jgi:hypothetical protein
MPETSSPPPSTQARPKRRGLLALAYVVFLVALVEAGSWTYLALLDRASGLDLQVSSILGTVAPGSEPGQVPRPGAARNRSEGLHPYLGFMPRSAAGDVPGDVYMVWQPRTYEADSPLFSSDPDELVVGITGGSVAGQFARFGGAEQLGALLAQSPAYSGRRVRFVAVAFGGLKQPQQLMGLSYLLALGGRLDLLINLDGFNEVALHEADNQPQGIAPSYPRSWFHRVSGSETLLLVGQRRVLQDERSARAEAILASPLRYSGLGRALWVRQDQALQAELERVGEELRAFEPSSIGDLPTLGPPSAAAGPSGRLDELVAIWERCSLQLMRLCEANGIEYYHFLQPNQYVADSKVMTEDELREAYRPGEGYGRFAPAGYKRLQVAARSLIEAGVRFHDLTDVYRDVAETVYVDDCCHVNELGNVLMAEAIREALASWGG